MSVYHSSSYYDFEHMSDGEFEVLFCEVANGMSINRAHFTGEVGTRTWMGAYDTRSDVDRLLFEFGKAADSGYDLTCMATCNEFTGRIPGSDETKRMVRRLARRIWDHFGLLGKHPDPFLLVESMDDEGKKAVTEALDFKVPDGCECAGETLSHVLEHNPHLLYCWHYMCNIEEDELKELRVTRVLAQYSHNIVYTSDRMRHHVRRANELRFLSTLPGKTVKWFHTSEKDPGFVITFTDGTRLEFHDGEGYQSCGAFYDSSGKQVAWHTDM